MFKKAMTLAALGATLSFATAVEARPYRVGQIPSGPDNTCANCHVSPAGGGPRNVFGTDVEEGFLFEDGARLSVDWNRRIADMDSDGDGYTNGAELGDPEGEWTDEDIRDFSASLPGDASSTLCGDRRINGPEECDGIDRDEESCESLGYGAGFLRCDSDCTFDISGCEDTSICGDGILQESEQCDGERIRGRRCDELGFSDGVVTCDDECRFDTSGCFDTDCGDGVVEGREQCEGDESVTCESLDLGEGTATCNICRWNTSDCVLPEPVCGDGSINTEAEECDGEELDGANCMDFEFDLGTVVCSDDCLFDTTGCRMVECGDGVVEGDEECDGEDMGGADCTDFDLPNGMLFCTDACEIDTSACIEDDDTGGPPETIPDVAPDVAPDVEPDVEPDTDANEGSGDAGEETGGGGGGGGGGGCSTSPETSAWGLAGLLALVGLRRRRRAA